MRWWPVLQWWTVMEGNDRGTRMSRVGGRV